MLLTRELLQTVGGIAKRAGAEIMEVYQRTSAPDVISKADESPLTEADLRANAVIVSALAELAPQIPIISEESAEVPFAERKNWQCFWLVDPLDGTREFLSGNGEFTVNIALVENGAPVLGVVHVPVTGISYLGLKADANADNGAWKCLSDKTWQEIQCRSLPPASKWSSTTLRVIASRRHHEGPLRDLLAKLSLHFADLQMSSLGSSLKMCLLAEGKADFYPRLAPTSEWDTAAAHAVLKAAGGDIFDLSLKTLEYNQKAGMLNPYFLASADVSAPWVSLLHELNNNTGQ
jgi:3'(2'), 5'-bisphosphate nucleotidase